MGFMAGKRALIVGLASTRSIAWGIAQAFAREGAELAFTYQNDKLKPRVEKFAAELGSELTFPLDVGSDDEIDAVVASLSGAWDGLDVLVHSVGFAPRDQLAGLTGVLERQLLDQIHRPFPVARSMFLNESPIP